MSTPINNYPILGYWIRYNPKTHQGDVGLQMDNDPDADIKFENLSAEDVAVLTAILSRGGARYYNTGYVAGRW